MEALASVLSVEVWKTIVWCQGDIDEAKSALEQTILLVNANTADEVTRRRGALRRTMKLCQLEGLTPEMVWNHIVLRILEAVARVPCRKELFCFSSVGEYRHACESVNDPKRVSVSRADCVKPSQGYRSPSLLLGGDSKMKIVKRPSDLCLGLNQDRLLVLVVVENGGEFHAEQKSTGNCPQYLDDTLTVGVSFVFQHTGADTLMQRVNPLHVAGLGVASKQLVHNGERLPPSALAVNGVGSCLPFSVGSIWLVKEPFFTCGVTDVGKDGVWVLRVDNLRDLFYVGQSTRSAIGLPATARVPPCGAATPKAFLESEGLLKEVFPHLDSSSVCTRERTCHRLPHLLESLLGTSGRSRLPKLLANCAASFLNLASPANGVGSTSSSATPGASCLCCLNTASAFLLAIAATRVDPYTIKGYYRAAVALVESLAGRHHHHREDAGGADDHHHSWLSPADALLYFAWLKQRMETVVWHHLFCTHIGTRSKCSSAPEGGPAVSATERFIDMELTENIAMEASAIFGEWSLLEARLEESLKPSSTKELLSGRSSSNRDLPLVPTLLASFQRTVGQVLPAYMVFVGGAAEATDKESDEEKEQERIARIHSEGNELFKGKEYAGALKKYCRAMQLLLLHPADPPGLLCSSNCRGAINRPTLPFMVDTVSIELLRYMYFGFGEETTTVGSDEENVAEPEVSVAGPDVLLLPFAQRFEVRYADSKRGRGLFLSGGSNIGSGTSASVVKEGDVLFRTELLNHFLFPTREVNGRLEAPMKPGGEEKEGEMEMPMLAYDGSTNILRNEQFLSGDMRGGLFYIRLLADPLTLLQLRVLRPTGHEELCGGTPVKGFAAIDDSRSSSASLKFSVEFWEREQVMTGQRNQHQTVGDALLPKSLRDLLRAVEADFAAQGTWCSLRCEDELSVQDAVNALHLSMPTFRAIFYANAFDFEMPAETPPHASTLSATADRQKNKLCGGFWTMGALMNHSSERPNVRYELSTARREPIRAPVTVGECVAAVEGETKNELGFFVKAVALTDIEPGTELVDQYFESHLNSSEDQDQRRERGAVDEDKGREGAVQGFADWNGVFC